MSEDSLEGVEFTSDSEERTPGEFIDSTHGPDVLYYYIQDAYEKTESGVEIDVDGKEELVRTHAQVEVFQSAIQYVEAFGIYLLSYVKGKDDLVTNLVQTEPKDLRHFFESLQDGTENEYLQNQGVEDDYRTVMESLFGYAYINDVKDSEVSEQELEEAIDQSIEVLDANIRRIGEFYLYFHDIYNAVKHGNRALPQLNGEFSITDEDGEKTSLTSDMDFVMFLCRNERAQPYLVSIPIDYLLEHSLKITEKVYRMFTYLKKISQAGTTEEEVGLSFFKFKETDDEDEQEWITATHESGVIILPKIEEIEKLQQPMEWTFPARIEVDHRTLYIRTQQDEETSDEYPLMITVLQRGLVGLSPQPLMGVDFNIDVLDLDVDQYFEYLELQKLEIDGGGVDEITIIDEQADRELETGNPEDFNIPETLEEFLEWERLEQLYWLQKISGERIPIPFNLAQDQVDIIDDCIESNPDRGEVIAAVEELREIGKKNHWTTVHVDLLRLFTEEEIRSEVVGQFPGEVNFDDAEFADEELTEEFEEKWGEPGHEIRFPAVGYDGGCQDLVNLLSDDISKTEQILAQLAPKTDRSTPPKLLVKNQVGDHGFWYSDHTLRFQFLRHQVRVNVQQRCPLCKRNISTDLRTHLAENCNASP